MTRTNPDSVACSLSPEALARRRAELRAGVLTRVVATRTLQPAVDSAAHEAGSGRARDAGEGLAFALPASDDARRELEALIDFERRCCGFAQYAIRDDPGHGLLWLEVRGPAGTRALFEKLAALPTDERRENCCSGSEGDEPGGRRARIAGMAGLAGAGSAAVALLLCASPALAALLGLVGMAGVYPELAGWIDAVAPAVAAVGVLTLAATQGRRLLQLSRNRRRIETVSSPRTSQHIPKEST